MTSTTRGTDSASYTSTLVRAGVAALPLLAAAHAAPVISSFGPLRNRFLPGLAGQGKPGHIALTFDDGPDQLSTPHFLRLLDARGVRATFFLLGSMAVRFPGLVREMAGAGHEIAVHGWAHRPLLLRGSRATYDDLARAQDSVGELTGAAPTLFRPPYGVMTTGTHLACRRLGLTPVLWTAWGEDWRARATPRSIRDTVLRDLRSGGTVLLHDSDCTSATDSWRNTLAALPLLLEAWEARGWRTGPLRDHRQA
ncbi:Peptidoglycan/xylan/chitin deacetylase, PgdA/CDA1 family [Streptomyces sp. DvalAA-14]|uniref:polysaccharide deacetylase family protein n=1 Tax=unclassified Streptomyces TaxID=2593676 RepID=UPI00081B8822|nr:MULTISPECIES: polysaccharide deacetylase family protein [unclassified Streptomyces]MYS22037.1 polysaccharide deacetylase family protein [Streptomyces sp. SID4948]SCE07188.1 Peptidoglycan/xylan/chitin deacetylase, PgdA/CDA1 family [Streptomyces sp. DvalAA-14]